jgi:hypothetical protein
MRPHKPTGGLCPRPKTRGLHKTLGYATLVYTTRLSVTACSIKKEQTTSMTRVRLITMALAAMLCLGAVSASGAFATAKKGEISTSTTSGVAPVKGGFTGKSAKTGDLETVKGSKIECSATALTGTVTSGSTTKGTATFTFTGCKSLGLKCNTTSAASGEVVVPVALEGSVVSEKDYLLNKVTEFDIKCSTVDIKVKGNLDVPATPEGSLSTKYTFNAKGSKGVQSPVDSVTPHLEASFSGAAFENASMQAEGLETTFEESVAFI